MVPTTILIIPFHGEEFPAGREEVGRVGKAPW
jgi:hypothetical protein